MKLEHIEKEHLSYLVLVKNSGRYGVGHSNKKKTSIAEQMGLWEQGKMDSLVFMESNGGPVGLLDVFFASQSAAQADSIVNTAMIQLAFEDREQVGLNVKSGLNSLAAEALQLSLRYCFYEHNCHKVSSLLVHSDQAMLDLFRANGFKNEVRWRHHYYGNGSYQSVIEVALFKEEYRQT